MSTSSLPHPHKKPQREIFRNPNHQSLPTTASLNQKRRSFQWDWPSYPPLKKTPTSDRIDNINSFINTIKRQYYFHDPNDQTVKKAKHPFWMPTEWIPPEPENNALQTFFAKIKEAPRTQPHPQTSNNLTPSQINALTSLTNNENITIKAADKGGGICVMDTTEYIRKIMHHLNNTNTYKKLDHNPLNNIRREISDYLEFLVTVGHT